jgi:hypothetical protein
MFLNYIAYKLKDISDIDFDAAQAAWRANKRSIGGGTFEYVCQYIHSNGKPCRLAACVFRFCKKHRISGPKKTNFNN